MLSQTGDNSLGNRAAVDGDADLLVRNASQVIDPGRVEDRPPVRCSAQVPPVEDGLWQCPVQQASEAGAAGPGKAHEGSVRGGSDANMVGVTRNPIGSERGHDVRDLVLEDVGDTVNQLIERHLVDGPIWVSKPLVPVRDSTVGTPGLITFGSTDGAEGLRSSGKSFTDIAGLPVGHVNEHIPEVRVRVMKRNRPCHAIGVVIRVCRHHGQSVWMTHA